MKRTILAAMMLAGCQQTTAPAPAPVDGAPSLAGCAPAGIARLVGRPLATAMRDAALRDRDARSLRVIRPGMAVTMDYRTDRLNVEVDKDDIVRAMRCG